MSIAIETMEHRVDVVLLSLAEALTAVANSEAELRREVARARAAVADAEGHLDKALGGMTITHWCALVTGRASIRTSAGARAAHLARKRRPAVEAALSELSAARLSREMTEQAHLELCGREARGLARFGSLAIRIWESEQRPREAAPVTRREPHLRNSTTSGGPPMKVRNAVKDYQRRLADLDAQYSRSQERLDAAIAKRAKLLEEQDQLVAAAQSEVEDAIAAMALDAGVDLTASLLGVEPSRVRRLLRDGRRRPGGAAPADPGRSQPSAPAD